MRLVILALLLVGCGASLGDRLATANTALMYTDIAFDAFDKQHETDIANSCTSKDDCTAKLAAYRTSRAKFDKAWGAVIVAMKAVVAVQNNDTIAGLEAAAIQAAQNLAALQGVK